MEYLRDEEDEKKESEEDLPGSKDDISEEGSEPETNEAWNVPEKKRSKIDLVPKLMIIVFCICILYLYCVFVFCICILYLFSYLYFVFVLHICILYLYFVFCICVL